MRKNEPWVYWPEQCKYCINRKKCEYKEFALDYIYSLQEVESSNIYGSLYWWCDYYIIDIEKYNKENPGECEA